MDEQETLATSSQQTERRSGKGYNRGKGKLSTGHGRLEPPQPTMNITVIYIPRRSQDPELLYRRRCTRCTSLRSGRKATRHTSSGKPTYVNDNVHKNRSCDYILSCTRQLCTQSCSFLCVGCLFVNWASLDKWVLVCEEEMSLCRRKGVSLNDRNFNFSFGQFCPLCWVFHLSCLRYFVNVGPDWIPKFTPETGP
eukprot:1175509-Amphidinium_carterae.1